MLQFSSGFSAEQPRNSDVTTVNVRPLLRAIRRIARSGRLRSPVHADFVELAEDWQWCSAHARFQRADERRWLAIPDDPPLPRNWRLWVNKVGTEAELSSLRRSVKRGVPFTPGLETTTGPQR